MADLPKLGLLLALYGGPAVVGLLILLLGLYAAQRKGPIIAAAVVGGAFVLLQALLLSVLSDMGRAWGGSADHLLIAGGALLTLAGVVAVPVFLAHKLPRAGAPDGAVWSNSAVACGALVLCVLIHLATSLRNANADSLGQLLSYPRLWLVTLLGLLAAWGLWQRRAWAWWLAVIGSSWELVRLAGWLVAHPAGIGPALVSLTGLTAALLVGVVLVLLRKSARPSTPVVEFKR